MIYDQFICSGLSISHCRACLWSTNSIAEISSLGRLYGIEKWNTYPFLHAESDLITKLDPEYQNHKTEILSLRINRHGRFKLAKPCVNCQKMLDEIGITKVVWSCNLEDEVPNDLILGSQHKIMLERVIKRKINLSVTQEGGEAGGHKF